MASEVAALPMELLTGELDEMDESEFRSYAVRSQAAEEMVRLLVGLAESDSRPENAAKFLRTLFDDAQDLTDAPKEDVDAIVAENVSLKEQLAALGERMAALCARVPAGELKLSGLAVLNVPQREEAAELYMRVQLLSHGGADAAAAQTASVALAAEAIFVDELILQLPAARDVSHLPVLRVTLWDAADHASEGAEPLASAEVALDADTGEMGGVALSSTVADGATLSFSFATTVVEREAEAGEAAVEA